MRKSTDIDKIEMGVHSGRYLGSFFSFWYSFFGIFFLFGSFFFLAEQSREGGSSVARAISRYGRCRLKRKKEKVGKVVPRKNKPGMKIAHKTMKLTRV
jgi:hypothetical protein